MKGNESNTSEASSGLNLGDTLSRAKDLLDRTVGEPIAEIAVGEICSSRYQPRRYFAKKGMDELKASIHLKGLLQPITVFRLDDPNIEHRFELIGGERRLRCYVELDLPTIPAIIKNITATEALALVDAENRHRENLLFMEDLSIVTSHFQYCKSDSEVARHISKNQSTIFRYRKISEAIDLCPEFREWFTADSQHVTFATAHKFSSIAPALARLRTSNKHEWDRIGKRMAKSIDAASSGKKGDKHEGGIASNMNYLINYFNDEKGKDTRAVDTVEADMFRQTDKELILSIRIPKGFAPAKTEGIINSIRQFAEAANITL